MSTATYSTDPAQDARRYWDEEFARRDEQTAKEQDLYENFVRACGRRGPSHTAEVGFAGAINDYRAEPLTVIEGRPIYPQRCKRLAEVMLDALDYAGGPSLEDVMGLLLSASRGTDIRVAAQALVDTMARKWAEMEASA